MESKSQVTIFLASRAVCSHVGVHQTLFPVCLQLLFCFSVLDLVEQDLADDCHKAHMDVAYFDFGRHDGRV